ncbi:hypothetical protein YP72344_21810 [Yersinia pseudotuberculosis]|uniref:phage tail protein n=1 Tax=Yersinia pseudotuberculosis TaxID=633 RepID=UPI0025727047|nr:phage tail protein [Yersinia pseudotuberculosis]BCU90686.1 hypothetical protein YP72344_21810 [Yersinia pseudotuberculosis]
MTAKFYALMTNLGAAKLANATALGTQLQITHMAVGDGGGVLPTPNPAQTQLIGEKRHAALNSLSIDEVNSSQIIAEQVIPETDGGWWIREIGLFDKDGILIAIANCPETYKPQLQEGSGRTQTVRMVLIVSSTEAVTLKIDPSVVLATRKYADDKAIEVRQYADKLLDNHEKSRNHPDASKTEKGFVKLNSATDSDSETEAATPKSVKTAKEQAIKASREYDRVVNAFQLHPALAEINLNSLGQAAIGIYVQALDGFATLSRNYPITIAGSLIVRPSAYGAQQEYTPFYTGRKYIRNLIGDWNGSGPWSDWDQLGNDVAPAGIPMPWPAAIPPLGWLKCNGSVFDKSLYPQLAKVYPSGILPDLRGEFIRGLDDGRGLDNGRSLLTRQESDNKQHNHIFVTWGADHTGLGGGDNSEPAIPTPNGAVGFGAIPSHLLTSGTGATFGTASAIKTDGGSESRPRNVAFNYIVRAA